MPDPNVRTLVCPTCHTHAATEDGQFLSHPAADGSGSACTNTGKGMAELLPGQFSPTSMFASCPAATGESRCTDFPDRSHRCGEQRGHIRTEQNKPAGERTHLCTCGYRWTSLSGSVAELMNLMGPR